MDGCISKAEKDFAVSNNTVPIFPHNKKLLVTVGNICQELWRLEIEVGGLDNFQESIKITKELTYALYLKKKI